MFWSLCNFKFKLIRYRVSKKKGHDKVLMIFQFSMSPGKNHCTFSNSPMHADYENDFNSISRYFLGQDI